MGFSGDNSPELLFDFNIYYNRPENRGRITNTVWVTCQTPNNTYHSLKEKQIKKLESKKLPYSPTTFSSPPKDFNSGYGIKGSVDRGKMVFDTTCLHCHKPGRIMKWPYTLDYNSFTFKFLNKHLTKESHFSIYNAIRIGVNPGKRKSLYMPRFSEERLSDTQIEDLRAFLESNKDFKK